MFLQKTYSLVILLRKMFELLSAINEKLKSESGTECSIIGKKLQPLEVSLSFTSCNSRTTQNGRL